MSKQLKYIAVRPGGDICGPVGNTEEFVRQALIIGYCRASNIPVDSLSPFDDLLWQKIEALGYEVRLAEMHLCKKGAKP